MSQLNLTMFNNLCIKQDKSENLYVYQIDDNTFILSKKLDDGYRQATIITRSTYTALDSLSPKMISRILELAPEYDCLSSMWKALKDTHNPPRDKFFRTTEPPSFLIHNLDLLFFRSHINVQAYDMIYDYLIVKAYDNIYRIDRSPVANFITITNSATAESLAVPTYKDKVALFNGIDFCCQELKA